jgi:RimK family alpha-L-glutamate ligase
MTGSASWIDRTVAIIGGPTKGNLLLEENWRRLGCRVYVTDADAAERLDADAVVLVRLDVLETLDGIEPGLEEIAHLVRRGFAVLNPPSALVAVHDKLVTHELLRAAGVPHPAALHVTSPWGSDDDVPLPCVVKPRFGSWGRDIARCFTREELRWTLSSVAERSWFKRHGALLQELVPSQGSDLRVLVAGGCAVGVARRVAAPGEWRTNVSLGGVLEPLPELASAAAEAALDAAAAVGIDLACVDLLPTAHGPVVLELNGAADFDARYSLPGQDVYLEAARALRIVPPATDVHVWPPPVTGAASSPPPAASATRR